MWKSFKSKYAGNFGPNSSYSSSILNKSTLNFALKMSLSTSHTHTNLLTPAISNYMWKSWLKTNYMQIILVQTVAALGSISTLNLTLKLSLSTSHTHLLKPAISNYKGSISDLLKYAHNFGPNSSCPR